MRWLGPAFDGSSRDEPFWAPAFEVACTRNNIDHRLGKSRADEVFGSDRARAVGLTTSGGYSRTPHHGDISGPARLS